MYIQNTVDWPISFQRLFPFFSLCNSTMPTWVFEQLSVLVFPQCLSCTVIHRSVFSLQLIHVQIEIRAVLRCCEPALHWLSWALIRIWMIINNPFKSFSRCLADPVHPIATKSESTAGTGQFAGTTWSHNYWLFRLCEHNLRVNTYRERERKKALHTFTIVIKWEWVLHFTSLKLPK